jgi:hypothetical protein
VLAAAKRNGAEDVTGGFGHASGGVRDDAGDVFYDAEEHAFAWRVEA